MQYAAIPDAQLLEQYPDNVPRIHKIEGLIKPATSSIVSPITRTQSPPSKRQRFNLGVQDQSSPDQARTPPSNRGGHARGRAGRFHTGKGMWVGAKYTGRGGFNKHDQLPTTRHTAHSTS